MRTLRLLSLLLCILYTLTSCSLDYASIDEANASSPEFVFYDAEFTRTEDNKKTIQMKATQLEQYSGLDAMYLENASFALFDSDLQPNINGSAELLSADMDKDIYHFFGDVYIASHEHDVEVTAQNLRWNNKTEVLSSGLRDKVSIATGSGQTLPNANETNAVAEDSSTEGQKQTRISIEGTGFSANGVDLSYSFEGSITGNIIEETLNSSEEE